MSEQRFFICKQCGNLVGLIFNADVPMVCCGEPMTELKANTVDASREKHVPVVSVQENLVTVKIGSAPHPMITEHFIQWVYLQTAAGGQRKGLKPGEAPEAVFALYNDKPIAAYAYCNLHGLWKTEL